MASVESSKRSREEALNRWAMDMLVRSKFNVSDDFRLVSASDDASFRRYFRGKVGEGSFIFVDAPPELEDSRPFIEVARLLKSAGLSAPDVHHEDMDLGFMMLTDFGERLYLDAIGEGSERVEELYRDAIEGIVRMQRMGSPSTLPPYNEQLLRREMALFTDWLLPKQLLLETSKGEAALIARVFDLMVANAEDQPQAFVHRDYHCRNLMVIEEANPGIIDFQDAVVGPITYDLVSLLKDCYHRFPQELVDRWVEVFRLRLAEERMIDGVSSDAFTRWFDLMGMQRHIKVAGIFSRLNLRDGKPRYLADIPLVVSYITDVCDKYDDLANFGNWMKERVVPSVERIGNT